MLAFFLSLVMFWEIGERRSHLHWIKVIQMHPGELVDEDKTMLQFKSIKV